jgi:small GTP-binding protein
VIAGDSSSGKSKILQRFTTGKFEGNDKATIGCEFISKTIDLDAVGSRVRLQLWDTAGSEKYRSMTTNHFRNAVGALLVYDISNEESFNNLTFWIGELKSKLDPYAMIGLFANKVDIMFSHPEEREVFREQGIQFAREHQLFFLDECSAKEDIMVKDSIIGLCNGIYNI